MRLLVNKVTYLTRKFVATGKAVNKAVLAERESVDICK
jgi:hypothetical protein